MGIKNFFERNKNDTYNNFPDAIIVLDFMRNIVAWNTRAEMLFGYVSSEVLGKNITLIFSEDFEKLNQIIGLTYGTILRAVTKNGDEIFVDVTAYDAHNSAKTVICIRGVSNKFMNLQALLDDYQTTKSLISNRDSFLSNMKFDFTVPLNAAIGFSQSLLDEICGEVNDKQEKYISIINCNCRKLKSLLEKVFEIIQLDADKREFDFKSFDLVNIVMYTLNSIKSYFEVNGIEIKLINELEKKNTYSDEYAFISVLNILLENALKFTKNGEVVVKLSHPATEELELHNIKIPSGYTDKSYFKLEISDTGIGVSNDRFIEIFDEYNSKSLATAQKYGGTALSLPIAKKIITKLNGVIWAEANQPNGTVFNIILPMDKMSFSD